MLLSSRRYADTSVLSLVPLKHLALNAREVPSEPCSQPPRAEPLPTQAEDGPAMVAAVEEPSALPPLLMGGGGRMSVETAASPTALEPLARAVQMWWLCPRMRNRRLPRHRGIMMSR
jgi:hypothetical protein